MRRLHIIALLIFAGIIAGCSSATKPLRRWQASVESYIIKQEGGNYNALRNVNSKDRPSQKSFRLINAMSSGIPIIAPSQTDVNGLLLAHCTINGNNWYIFLVGTVKYDGKFRNIPLDDPCVKDVRLIALTGDLDSPVWVVGSSCDAALDQYRIQQTKGRSARNANSTFPSGYEALELAITDQQITVVDQQSQAQWTLSIPAEIMN